MTTEPNHAYAREFIFTFGFGQTNPDTGRSRARRFVRIQAHDAESARMQMLEQYGREWAFMHNRSYPSFLREARLWLRIMFWPWWGAYR